METFKSIKTINYALNSDNELKVINEHNLEQFLEYGGKIKNLKQVSIEREDDGLLKEVIYKDNISYHFVLKKKGDNQYDHYYEGRMIDNIWHTDLPNDEFFFIQELLKSIEKETP